MINGKVHATILSEEEKAEVRKLRERLKSAAEAWSRSSKEFNAFVKGLFTAHGMPVTDLGYTASFEVSEDGDYLVCG